VIEKIKVAVHSAARKNQKIAMFHFQVLKNADELVESIQRDFAGKSRFQKLLQPSSQK